MKAYLYRNDTLLYPFRKSAAQLGLKGGTVRSRLIEQIKRQGLTLIECDDIALASVDPGSLVLADNLLMSDNFLAGFLASLPHRKQNYCAHVDMGRLPMFSQKYPPVKFRALPLCFIGNPDAAQVERDDKGSDEQNTPTPASMKQIAATCEVLEVSPKPLYSLSQGIPARMHNIDELRIYFVDRYAVPLDYWFDVQTAFSQYSREYVAKMLAPAVRFLPGRAVEKVMSTQWLVEKGNVIGKNCRIHPTAILEGCIIGDNVEIGPFSYLRSVVVDDNVSLREKSSIKTSYLGPGSFIMGSDVVNCYIGKESSIFTPLLYNVVFGEKSFISGGSGFADFNVGGGDIVANIRGEKINTGLNFLGSCVGDNCFLGANLIFAAGQAIPDGTRILDNGLVKTVPVEFDGTYVVSGSKCIQIPASFLGVSST